MEFACLVCLYVRVRPGLDEDALSELTLLTMCNGQMVCLRHVPCANGTHHDTIKSGVFMESQGEMTSLAEYQDWRSKQED